MIRRYHPAFFAALLLLGCGAPQTSDKDAAGETKTSLRITNINQSDLAVCFPKQPEVPGVVTKEVLIGLLVAARPQVMECFVDPKNRGAGKETRAVVKTSITNGALENTVSGENLSPDGQKCIQDVVAKWLGGIPNLAAKVPAGSPPIVAEAPFHHVLEVSPSVQLGINEASDVTGTVRLAQTNWCDCYADWKDAAPRSLKVKIRLLKRGAESDGPKSVAPAEVTFEPTNDAAADGVAACLQKKVRAQSFKVTPEEITLPYSFLFVNTSHTGPLGAGEAPELQVAQLDGLRGQRAAATLIATGARFAAAGIYDGLVQKFKAKQDSVPVDELKAKCADLLKADDAWIAAVERQLEAEQNALKLASELKAKDERWARAEELARSSLDATKKDLETTKKIKTDDTGICPKERF